MIKGHVVLICCVAMQATIRSGPANGDFSLNPRQRLFKILFPSNSLIYNDEPQTLSTAAGHHHKGSWEARELYIAGA